METDYIIRGTAVTIADYAADEHPYDKDPQKPETYSEYNQGWNDACDYIRDRLEREKPADVKPVRHGRWNRPYISWFFPLKIRNPYCFCTYCGHPIKPRKATDYCPNCGAKMDLEGEIDD